MAQAIVECYASDDWGTPQKAAAQRTRRAKELETLGYNVFKHQTMHTINPDASLYTLIAHPTAPVQNLPQKFIYEEAPRVPPTDFKEAPMPQAAQPVVAPNGSSAHEPPEAEHLYYVEIERQKVSVWRHSDGTHELKVRVWSDPADGLVVKTIAKGKSLEHQLGKAALRINAAKMYAMRRREKERRIKEAMEKPGHPLIGAIAS